MVESDVVAAAAAVEGAVDELTTMTMRVMQRL